VRERLFTEWVRLLDLWSRFKTTEKLGARDNKKDLSTQYLCENIVEILYLDLENYGINKTFESETLEEKLRILSALLFKLGITDASIKEKERVVMLDW